MIPVTPQITLDDAELQEDFLRASGAGGQNGNLFVLVRDTVYVKSTR